MTRLIVFLVSACVIAGIIAWLADNNGVVTLVIAGYEWRTSAIVAGAFTLVLAAVLAVIMRLAVYVISTPARFGEWSTQRRARKFFQSLSRGLVAAASGDADEAALFARRSDKLLHDQPLALLLNAQSAQLAGDSEKVQAAYRDMLRIPEMEFLGLRGLFEQAVHRHDEAEALALATRAHALKPKAWAMDALFDLRVWRREWRDAQALVVRATRAKSLTPEVAKRKRAVLLAAQAVEAERAGDAASLEHALESLALAPGLTAPALIAGRHLTQQGRSWKAQDVIEAAWTEAPHRELAQAYGAIWPGDQPQARAQRLIALAKLNPRHRESRVLMAEQSVVLKRWDEARNLLEPLAEDFSSARVCNLMAELAQGEDDVLTAPLWRSRAARAGRITDWRCTRCNTTAPDWEAVCPHCGAFDTLKWTAPEMPVHEPPKRTQPAPTVLLTGTEEPIVEAAQRARPNGQRKDETPPRHFVRPDDPGPEGQDVDMFGATAEAESRPAETADTPERGCSTIRSSKPSGLSCTAGGTKISNRLRQ
jgi:HemY protein